MTTALLAFAAGVLAIVALVQLGSSVGRRFVASSAAGVRVFVAAAEALMRLGREGREPGALERRRLLACGAVAAFAVGLLLAGTAGAAGLAVAAPAAVGRALRARRLAYRRAVDEAAPAIAVALADALAGGHSLRRAIVEAADGVNGPGGVELRRVAAELATGERTEGALERLRERCPTSAIDAIAAAALVHRRSGGDLAGLLRSLARSFEDERRIADEARVATAQARFTGLLVVVLPLGGALLAELASPGFLRGLATSTLTAWLVGLAVLLQAVAGLLIRRIGRSTA